MKFSKCMSVCSSLFSLFSRDKSLEKKRQIFFLFKIHLKSYRREVPYVRKGRPSASHAGIQSKFEITCSATSEPIRPPHYNLSWNTLGESYHCATFSIRRDVALFTQGVSPLQNQYKRVFFFRNYSSQHNLLTYWESAVRTEFHFFCARLGAPQWRRQCQAALRERVFTRFLNFPLRKKKKKRVSYERSKYLWRNTCSFSIYIACTIFLSRGAFYFQYFVMGEKRIEGLNGS